MGGTIGRYFSVVSMLPSTLLVSWLALLVAGGAGTQDFAPMTAWQAARGVTFGDIVVLATVALAVSLVINPFQFAATQLLEGYWGGTRWGLAAATSRINNYRRVLRLLVQKKTEARKALQERANERGTTERGLLLGSAGDDSIRFQVMVDSLEHDAGRYPESARILPTRLGNALRAFEDSAGREYGLDALNVAGHLSLLPSNERSAYVRDTRESLDLGVRLCIVFCIATPITCILLARESWWVLLALVPYFAAYMSYRGAAHAAVAYGNAVRFQIDLDRFALYEALHISEPGTTERERQQNADLMALLSRDPRAWRAQSMRYRTSQAGAPTELAKRASRPK